MDCIEINNLSLTYCNKKTKVTTEALNKVSVNFPLGKTTVIIGEIGSGKTSLLKVLCGILPYDEGTILYKEKDIDEIYVEDRNFAYVSQNPTMIAKKTIFDNLAIPLLNKKIKRDEIREKIYKITEEFGISHLLSRKSNEISLGQLQKSCIAKAFLREPDVFLFDEPFSNLDREFVEEFRPVFKKKINENNLTCIFVTHNIEDAMFLADYIAVLKDGKLIDFGTKERIFYSNNQEVSELIHAEDLKDEK